MESVAAITLTAVAGAILDDPEPRSRGHSYWLRLFTGKKTRSFVLL